MKKHVRQSPQARAFIAELPPSANLKLLASVQRLEREGRLPAPYAEKVEGQDGLFEIRVKDGEQIRVFYAYAKGDDVWLLSGFIKKTQKTPPAEIRKALRIRKELGL
ncbi:MAG TPA: type II toxin-antitoxin system RelE/ParE family toxin [Candidatus Spyradenecus faecavium]|uniref:Type II toxin-antitoxin system RelE/ParE family toxin n=1 Tax=Candidatus Spyradenecus faecavium TaxID=2840947 RepID=A0A9D1T2S5_9BACT|nr:type II toxin-antitoxin system RelE/ParE family toxin [Candidatus Spyradenecus faecavium]